MQRGCGYTCRKVQEVELEKKESEEWEGMEEVYASVVYNLITTETCRKKLEVVGLQEVDTNSFRSCHEALSMRSLLVGEVVPIL